jgi:hypothetical protein
MGDHEGEARLNPPDRTIRAFVRIDVRGASTESNERCGHRLEPMGGWRVRSRKGETGPESVLATDVRAVTHPAVVTADEQVNPGG